MAKNKVSKSETLETLRRLRKRDLTEYRRRRYGKTFPNDDAGLADLIELLKPISLGRDPQRRMRNTIELDAPWIKDVDQIIDEIMAMSPRQRWPSAKELGLSLNLTNQQRECWRLWRIHPVDMNDRQMAEQRKAKKRARDQQRRRKAGRKPRAQWLAAALSRQPPWKAEGKSRAQWYRNRGRQNETGLRQTNSISAERTPVSLQKPVRPKEKRRRASKAHDVLH